MTPNPCTPPTFPLAASGRALSYPQTQGRAPGKTSQNPSVSASRISQPNSQGLSPQVSATERQTRPGTALSNAVAAQGRSVLAPAACLGRTTRTMTVSTREAKAASYVGTVSNGFSSAPTPSYVVFLLVLPGRRRPRCLVSTVPSGALSLRSTLRCYNGLTRFFYTPQLTLYSLAALIFTLLIWFNVWTEADIITIGNRGELVGQSSLFLVILLASAPPAHAST